MNKLYKKKKISILVSGEGSNMKHIIYEVKKGLLRNDFVVSSVISDRECKAIQYVINKKKIKFFSLNRKKENMKSLSKKINYFLLEDQPDIIVLAGFLSILNKDFCKKWKNKIINIHPSLLPKYGGVGMYGKKIHNLVIKNNDIISGATVHYVTENVDFGKIIMQKIYKISSNETVSSLEKKISKIEKKILIKSIKKFFSYEKKCFN